MFIQRGGEEFPYREVAPGCFSVVGGICSSINQEEGELFFKTGKITKVFDVEAGYLKRIVEDGVAANVVISRSGKQMEIKKGELSILLLRDDFGRVISALSSDISINYEWASNGTLTKLSREDSSYEIYKYVSEDSSLLSERWLNGVPYAFWEYDQLGRVVLSYHALNTDRETMMYSGNVVTHTNSLGKKTKYEFSNINGALRLSKVEGIATDSCVGGSRSYTYDANGFVDELTNFSGEITDYDYDLNGLEVKRVETKGSPEERIISTEWDQTSYLPLRIVESNRVISFSYDDSGRLLNRTELAR
ncbi:hypothetical protein [Agaribacterium sp. ZY112]|uniref:hypothetical protein n=1 Tax=Agaribacterium sp. ZY112 TaxID=3233574 RepID=UPI003525A07F